LKKLCINYHIKLIYYPHLLPLREAKLYLSLRASMLGPVIVARSQQQQQHV
jgi:hypothetical protein